MTTEQREPSQDYNGYRVTFSQRYMNFQVNFDAEDPDGKLTFASFLEARKAIDAQRVKEAKNKTVSLLVVTAPNGAEREITGLNLSSGKITGLGVHPAAAYPREAWIVETLVDLTAAELLVQKLTDKLKIVQVRPPYHYGTLSPEAYVKMVDELEKNFNKATDLAAAGAQS